ncbi:MAG: hypothetical protein WD335_03785 [Candidatus Paceibacterota bacterium]
MHESLTKKIVHTTAVFLVNSLKHAFGFLPITGLIILTLTSVLMLGSIITVDLAVIFDKYLPDSLNTISIDENDLWRWYLYGSMAFGIISEIVMSIFGENNPDEAYCWWCIPAISGVILIFIFILIPFQQLATSTTLMDMYIVFALFALLISVSGVAYTGVRYSGDKLLKFIQSISVIDK